MIDVKANRIPLRGGDEFDGLPKRARRVHLPGIGVVRALKRRYHKRFRRMLGAALRRYIE